MTIDFEPAEEREAVTQLLEGARRLCLEKSYGECGIVLSPPHSWVQATAQNQLTNSKLECYLNRVFLHARVTPQDFVSLLESRGSYKRKLPWNMGKNTHVHPNMSQRKFKETAIGDSIVELNCFSKQLATHHLETLQHHVGFSGERESSASMPE